MGTTEDAEDTEDPTPKQPAGDAIPRLVPEGTCVICKKRPAEAGRDKCATCRAALAG